MPRKIYGLIILLFGLALLSAIVYYFFFRPDEFPLSSLLPARPPAAEESRPPEMAGEASVSEPVREEIMRIVHEETKIEPKKVTEEDLKRMASSFAERFGSYSNQSNFSNIRDLRIFMTPRMQTWADGYVAEMRERGGAPEIYYGITTKALFMDTAEFDDDVGRARIIVRTQRREATGTMANADSFAQDIAITFLKSGGAWKVDAAAWQD